MKTCIIVGAVSKIDSDASDAVIKMLRALESEFPTKMFTLHSQQELLESSSVTELEKSLRAPSSIALATACLLTSQERCVAVGDPGLNSVAMTGKIFNLPEAPTSMIKRFEECVNETNDIELHAKRFLESLDGQYAFVLRRGDTFLLARDPIGAKPLYVAENEQLIAFSTRRRPLWVLGLTNLTSLPQPTLISNRKLRRISPGIRMEALNPEENSAIESLTLLLRDVIKKIGKRAGGKVVVLFSGGLDSSIVAKLSKDLGIHCTLYCAGTASSRDMTGARRMSSALDLPLVEKEVTYDDVASSLVPVVRLIESIEMVAVSTSLPIYFAIKESVTRGEKTILYGQGADELFGGYERYEDILSSSGHTALCNEMLNDILGLGTSAPMYDQIGTMNLTELFAPFLDPAIVMFSLGIPLRLKLFRENSRISRKYILRKVAQRIGVPIRLLPEQKVAMQFGSGVARILDKIARDAGYTKSVAKRSGFPLPIKAYLKEVGKLAEVPS
nr:asparagine synthetase B [Candidatus Njordarchaeum guaymaensis]